MKTYLETIKIREAREAKLESYQSTLSKCWQEGNDDEDRTNLDELYDIVNKEWLFLRSNKEWLFNFQDGGWNSMMAADKETAIRLAKEEYKGSSCTIVDEKTFRLRTEADYKQLISLFH